MSVRALISQGEGRTVEFKAALPKGAQLAQTAAAFANGSGGTLLIGVGDDGDVIGVPDGQLGEVTDAATNAIVDGCAPMIMFDTTVVRVGEAAVVAVTVYPGAQKPYYLKKLGIDSGVVVRAGASNRKADASMVAELDRQRRHVSYDEEILYEQDVSSLDLTRLKRDFHDITGKELSDSEVLNLKIIRDDNGHRYPTVGGVLLCGREPLHPYVRVKAALFKGVTSTLFIDKKEFAGPIYQQVEDAMDFLKKHVNLRAHVEELQRIERYEIPMAALREAVLNAIVHRDYAMGGSDVKVAIFDDCVEITSPGPIPGNLSVADILEGRSELRNRVVGRFFERLGWVEHWGTGITKMRNLCREHGIPAPEIREKGRAVQVVFQRGGALPPGAEQDAWSVAESPGTYTCPPVRRHPLPKPFVEAASLRHSAARPTRLRGAKGVAALYDLICRKPGLRTPSLSAELGVPVKTLERWLSQLKQQGRVAYRGATRNGGYYP